MSQTQIKIIVEKHPEGYVAYPVGLKGVVVAEGDSYEEALAEAKERSRNYCPSPPLSGEVGRGSGRVGLGKLE